MLGLRRRLLFPRHLLVAEPGAAQRFEGVHRLTRRVAGGEVEAWFFAAPGASEAAPAPMVAFAHGNGELIEHWPEGLRPYLDRGVSVLLPEFRGYGRSAGKPSEAALVDDFSFFVEHAVARTDVDPHRVIFHGRSIGGGVVCSALVRRTPAALVLWSTFTSIDAVAARFGIPRWLIPDHFRNVDALARTPVPTLIVHGDQDELIPVAHALRLHAAAPHATVLRYDAGHNDCPPLHSGYWSALERFLRQANIAR